MKKPRSLPAKYSRLVTLGLCSVLLTGILVGCVPGGLMLGALPDQTSTLQQTWPISSQTPTPPPSPSITPIIWNTFAPPSGESATEVAPSQPRLDIPEDVKVWYLLGSDQEAPLSGRTPAIHVLFLNERLSKASVISIPGNLFVFIPGHTMQRINTAYALGGMELVKETLAYNFGIRPDRFVLAHPTEFKWLVDDLGGLEVSVLFPIRDACGGLPAGIHTMNGEKALCYVSLLSDQDEIDRTRRQQQVLQLLFTKLIQNGRLAKLPIMYASYQAKLETDISLLHLLTRIPLALRLGDPQRISYFLIGREQTQPWELPDQTQTQVLLPDPGKVEELFSQAIAAVSQPSPLGEVVLTYEAQLTSAVGMTLTAQPQPTLPPFMTQAPSVTVIVTATLPGSLTRTPTLTPTMTGTRVPTAIIPTQTPFPTQPYPVVTPVDTSTPYP